MVVSVTGCHTTVLLPVAERKFRRDILKGENTPRIGWRPKYDRAHRVRFSAETRARDAKTFPNRYIIMYIIIMYILITTQVC